MHRMSFIISIAVAMALASTGPAFAALVFNPANGHYYEAVISADITWDAANAQAAARSHLGATGHLATLTTAEENAFVVSFVSGGNDYFLGGFQLNGSAEPDGGWQWVTGESWGYTNWASGEPNNGGGITEPESALQFLNGSTWNDVRMFDHPANGYIVEFDVASVPEPSSIMLLAAAVGFLAQRRRRAA
jgi:hypothetical protein